MGHWTPSIKLHRITEILDSSRAPPPPPHRLAPGRRPPHVKGMRGWARLAPCVRGLAGAAMSRVFTHGVVGGLTAPSQYAVKSELPSWLRSHRSLSCRNDVGTCRRLDGWHAPRPSSSQRQGRKLAVEEIRTSIALEVKA